MSSTRFRRSQTFRIGLPAPSRECRTPGTPTASVVDERRVWRTLVAAASAPYRAAGRFAEGFARGKLGFDPVFRHLLADGLIPPRARLLDLGCGQGLIASLLRAAGDPTAARRWPAGWGAAPESVHVTGIELAAREVERARAALGDDAAFVCGDLRTTPFPPADVVVILDVLHYLALVEQDAVLARARAALSAGGLLLLRVGDVRRRGAFRGSQWVDRLVWRLRGRPAVTLVGRPLDAWTARLDALGFGVEARPMSQGTPFANVLLVGRLRRGAEGPAA